MERPIGFALHLAQMHEVRARGELAGHGGKIILFPFAERADAECNAVGGRVISIQNLAKVVRGGDDARQAIKRPWRIVGMDGELDAKLLGCGHDVAQKSDQ